jgi:hypothetical protein
LRWPLHLIDGSGHVPHLEAPGAFLASLATIETTTENLFRVNRSIPPTT